MIQILMATYHRADFLEKTLDSLGKEFKEHKAGELELNVYDNNSSKDIISLLSEFKKKFPYIVRRVVYGGKNIGKAKALNTFLPVIKDDAVVCSFDSDLVIQKRFRHLQYSKSFFEDGAIMLFAEKEGFCPSVLVPDQVGNGQHLVDKEWLTPEIEEEQYIKSEFGFHIAGGCLFTPGNVFKAVNGYRENRGLFGGNDGCYLLDASRYTGKPVYIYRNLVVYHPFEKDKEYEKWKLTAQDQQRKHQRCLMYKGYYDKPN